MLPEREVGSNEAKLSTLRFYSHVTANKEIHTTVRARKIFEHICIRESVFVLGGDWCGDAPTIILSHFKHFNTCNEVTAK